MIFALDASFSAVLRAVRWLIRLLFYPLFFLLLSGAVLGSTQFGSHLVASLLNRYVPAITVDYRSGTLNQQFQLNRFSLDLDFLYLELEDVNLTWNPWCTLQNKLCISAIEAKKFQLVLNKREPNKTNQAPKAKQPVDLNLPFAIEVAQAQVAQGDLRIYDIHIGWQQAEAAVELFNETIAVNKAHVVSGFVHVNASELAATPGAKSSKQHAQTTAWGKDHWPLAQLKRTYLPLRLLLPDVRADEFTLTIGRFDSDLFRAVAVNGDWYHSQARLKQFQFSHERYGTLAGRAQALLVHPYPLDLALRASPKLIPHFSNLRGSQWSLAAHGDLNQLHYQLKETKTRQWQLDGSCQLSSYLLPFTLSVQGEQMIWPNDVAAPIHYQQLQGQLSGDLAKQDFSLTAELATTQPNLSMAANTRIEGSHANQRITFTQLQAQTGDANATANTRSNLASTGYFDYSQGLNWQASVTLDQLQLPAFGLATGSTVSGQLSHQGHYQKQSASWQLQFADIDLNGRYQQQPFSLTGAVEFDQAGHVVANALAATLNETQLTLNGSRQERWQLDAQLHSRDLSRWQPDLAGDLALAITLRGEQESPVAHFQLRSEQLRYQQLAVKALRASGNYWPNQDHQFELELGSEQLTWQQWTQTQFELHAQGDRSQHQLTLHSSGDLDAQLSLSGSLDKQLSHWQGQLVQANWGLKQSHWLLAKPAKIEVKLPSQLTPTMHASISPHCWHSQQQSYVCLQQALELGGKSSTLSLSLELLAHEISDYLLPKGYQLQGALSGTAKATWGPSQALQANAALKAKRVVINYQSLLDGLVEYTAFDQLALDVKLDAQHSELALFIDSKQQGQIELAAKLAHQTQQLQGQLQITNYQAHDFVKLFPGLKQVKGQLNSQLQLAGSLSKPLLYGSAQIEQGQLELLANPTPIEQFKLQADFSGAQAKLNSQFTLGGGFATLNAMADWQQQLTLSATLSGKKLNVLLPPQSTITLNPELRFNYANGAAKLRGELYLPAAELKFQEIGASATPLSDDVVFVDKQQSGEPLAKKEPNLDMLLQLRLGDKVRLEAFGLTGWLDGQMDLKLAKDNALQIFGYTSLNRAKFAAYGQRLVIEDKSSVHFNGDPKMANLDIRATRTIKVDNVTAGLHITGNLKQPKVSFFSTPAMEQQEVLSYIVRGKGFRDEDANTSISTAATVGVSALSSLGINKPFEQLPGISDVSFDTEGEGDETQVTISGYVGDRIFLKYGIGVFEPINEVTVRLYLLSHLWLESVTGIEKSIDLYYSFFIE